MNKESNDEEDQDVVFLKVQTKYLLYRNTMGVNPDEWITMFAKEFRHFFEFLKDKYKGH